MPAAKQVLNQSKNIGNSKAQSAKSGGNR